MRRYLAARGAGTIADDLAQEALTRTLARRDQLADGAVLPYALSTARNLLVDHVRATRRASAHAHRVSGPAAPAAADELVLAAEERDALQVALDRLRPDEREVFLHHEAGVPLHELAEDRATSSGALAVRLAGVRARLRVDYVTSLRRVELPTARCRPVLVALTSGDRRRQEQLDVPGHVASCAACADLVEPLLQRRRALAGWWLVPAGAVTLRRLVRRHPVPSATAAVVIAAATVAGVVAWSSPPASPPPVAGPPPLVGRVGPVAADEGFWFEPTDGGSRTWVQLVVDGESRPEVREGAQVELVGVERVRHDRGFAAAVGVTAEEGGAELDRAGVHLELSAEGVRST